MTGHNFCLVLGRVTRHPGSCQPEIISDKSKWIKYRVSHNTVLPMWVTQWPMPCHVLTTWCQLHQHLSIVMFVWCWQSGEPLFCVKWSIMIEPYSGLRSPWALLANICPSEHWTVPTEQCFKTFVFVAKPKANGLNQTHETVVGEGEKLVEQRINPFLILSINL